MHLLTFLFAILTAPYMYPDNSSFSQKSEPSIMMLFSSAEGSTLSKFLSYNSLYTIGLEVES